jgi:hypothetical protein
LVLNHSRFCSAKNQWAAHCFSQPPFAWLIVRSGRNCQQRSGSEPLSQSQLRGKNELTLRQEARAKEEETRNSETLHWNPAGEGRGGKKGVRNRREERGQRGKKGVKERGQGQRKGSGTDSAFWPKKGVRGQRKGSGTDSAFWFLGGKKGVRREERGQEPIPLFGSWREERGQEPIPGGKKGVRNRFRFLVPDPFLALQEPIPLFGS